MSTHSSRPDLGVNAIYAAAKFALKLEELNGMYSLQGTTLNVGVINGGIGRNSVPGETVLDWEIRFLEERHQAEIFQKIEEFQKELSQGVNGLYIYTEAKEVLPAFERHDNSKIVDAASRVLGTEVLTLPIATEAGFLQKLGIETLICGAGDEKLAHSSSEHIKISDLAKYRDFLVRFVREIQKDIEH